MHPLRSSRLLTISIIIISIISLLSAFRILFFRSGLLEHYTSYFIYPFLKINQTIYFWKNQIIDQRSPTCALIKLKKKYLSLKAEHIQLQAEQNWLYKTQELRHFRHRYNTDHACVAQVLTIRLSDHEQSMLVDAGAVDGIIPGMIAVYNNMLVGRVTEVWSHYSNIMLITDKQCKVAAYCAKTGIEGVHNGLNHKSKTTLAHVSHLACLQVDDTVLSSGKGHLFPAGFCLGTIYSYKNDGLLHHIIVKPNINFSKLEYCYLINL